MHVMVLLYLVRCVRLCRQMTGRKGLTSWRSWYQGCRQMICTQLTTPWDHILGSTSPGDRDNNCKTAWTTREMVLLLVLGYCTLSLTRNGRYVVVVRWSYVGIKLCMCACACVRPCMLACVCVQHVQYVCWPSVLCVVACSPGNALHPVSGSCVTCNMCHIAGLLVCVTYNITLIHTLVPVAPS